MSLTVFQKQKNVDNDFVMGEYSKFNKLIVMNNVSRLSDKSEDFANFLTLSRKFGFSCIYVFQTMYPTRPSWQMIL